MRRIALFLMLAVPFTTLSNAQNTVAEKAKVAEKEVIEVEEQWNQALLNSNTDVLNRVFSDDLVFTNASGEVLTKAQLLERYRSGDLKFHSVNHTDMRRRVYGDTVVVTGRSDSTIEYRGKVSHGPRRFTNVYVKQGGLWQVVAHHTSNAAIQ